MKKNKRKKTMQAPVQYGLKIIHVSSFVPTLFETLLLIFVLQTNLLIF